MADFVYTRGIPQWASWTTDTNRVMLLESGYTPNLDHDFVSDVVAGEIDDGSYSRKTLTGKTQTIDDTNNLVKYDADDVTWAALAGGETVFYVVIYKFVTNDADSILMALVDIPNTVTDGTDFILQWSPDGIIQALQTDL